MPETTFIYGLVDPRTQELRYVGKANNPSQRWYNHLCTTEREHNHKANWIKQLRQIGMKPEWFSIEEVDQSQWQEAEIFWIRYFTYIGCNLTNGNEGGMGGVSPTPEVRQKRSVALRGRPKNPESVEKMRLTKTGKPNPKLKGRHVPAEHLKRMGELARTPEARAKQKISHKLRANRPENIARMKTNNPASRPEARAKISAAKKGRAAHKKGQRYSAEHRAKLCVSARERERRKKMKQLTNQPQLPGMDE